MSKEQIIQAEGDDLSRMAGEVLLGSECSKCQEYEGVYNNCQYWIDGVCEDGEGPIALTPANAFKFFNMMFEKHGKAKMIKAMQEVYISATGDTNGAAYVMDWWPFHADIEGNLKAAVICEINNA